MDSAIISIAGSFYLKRMYLRYLGHGTYEPTETFKKEKMLDVSP